MSKCPSQTGGMKIRHLFPELERRNAQLIATFGRAQLVRTHDRGYELRGGTPGDRVEAREWISLFMHDVVVGSDR